LLVGGYFHSLGDGFAANSIARWDAGRWHTLGGGIGEPPDYIYDYVLALALPQPGVVVAGGQFGMAGGVPAYYVAQWDGSDWQPLGSGMNGNVDVLAVRGHELVAGGWFSAAGDSSCHLIARWDGASWRTLGSGTDGVVLGLQCVGASLLVGGDFERAGAQSSWNIAEWMGPYPGAPAADVRHVARVSLPNPYRAGDPIEVTAKDAEACELAIYSVTGQCVATLRGTSRGSRGRPLSWNGMTSAGGRAPSGVYYLHSRLGTNSATQRILLVR
jgi:hypothetical protein